LQERQLTEVNAMALLDLQDEAHSSRSQHPNPLRYRRLSRLPYCPCLCCAVLCCAARVCLLWSSPAEASFAYSAEMLKVLGCVFNLQGFTAPVPQRDAAGSEIS